MNNDLHAESIVAIMFDYNYISSRFEIKQSNICKPWETIGSTECHQSVFIYLARSLNFHFDYGKHNKFITDKIPSDIY